MNISQNIVQMEDEGIELVDIGLKCDVSEVPEMGLEWLCKKGALKLRLQGLSVEERPPKDLVDQNGTR